VSNDIKPPKGYRLLKEGEQVLRGDIYCRGNGHPWEQCLGSIGYIWKEKYYLSTARKVTK
jgi:hypothetical protein